MSVPAICRVEQCCNRTTRRASTRQRSQLGHLETRSRRGDRHFARNVPVSKIGMGGSVHRGFESPLSVTCDESRHWSHLSRDIGLTLESSAIGRALAFGCASRSCRARSGGGRGSRRWRGPLRPSTRRCRRRPAAGHGCREGARDWGADGRDANLREANRCVSRAGGQTPAHGHRAQPPSSSAG